VWPIFALKLFGAVSELQTPQKFDEMYCIPHLVLSVSATHFNISLRFRLYLSVEEHEFAENPH
jgi:hypothetical protein